MKGLVKTAARTMTMQDLPDIKPNGKDVVVKVTHCGICGSDVHMWIPDDRIGMVFGHEFSGIVEDPGASGLAVGDRVAVKPSAPGYNYSWASRPLLRARIPPMCWCRWISSASCRTPEQ